MKSDLVNSDGLGDELNEPSVLASMFRLLISRFSFWAIQSAPWQLLVCSLSGRLVHSHWSRPLEALLWLVEIMVFLCHLSYAIKKPFKAPKVACVFMAKPIVGDFGCLELVSATPRTLSRAWSEPVCSQEEDVPVRKCWAWRKQIYEICFLRLPGDPLAPLRLGCFIKCLRCFNKSTAWLSSEL